MCSLAGQINTSYSHLTQLHILCKLSLRTWTHPSPLGPSSQGTSAWPKVGIQDPELPHEPHRRILDFPLEVLISRGWVLAQGWVQMVVTLAWRQGEPGLPYCLVCKVH